MRVAAYHSKQGDQPVSKVRIVFLALFASLAVLSAVASAASAAPEWLVELVKLTANETVEGLIDPTGSGNFNLEVPDLGVNILCTGVESVEGLLLAGTPANKDSAGAIKFTGCALDTPAKCVLKPTGTITTSPVETELIEGTTAGTVFDDFVAKGGAGNTFVSLTLTECSAEGEYPVTGLACGKIETPSVDNEIQLVTFVDKTEDAKCENTLKFGIHAALLLGEANFLLTGKNLDKKWSVL
jgi:hypothetical protein